MGNPCLIGVLQNEYVYDDSIPACSTYCSNRFCLYIESDEIAENSKGESRYGNSKRCTGGCL